MNSKFFFLSAMLLVMMLFLTGHSFSKVVSPKEQLESGIAPENVICREGLVLALKSTNDSPICVKPNTADNLVKKNLAVVPTRHEQIIDPDVEKFAKPDDTQNQTQNFTCDNIAVANPDEQTVIVESNLECIPVFFELLESEPQTHLQAFYQLVSSPIATDRLFSYMYDELYYDRFEMDEKTIDEVVTQLPRAIEKCEGSFRCPDWQKFIMPYISGQKIRNDCSGVETYGESRLVEVLHYADYYCTESIALALSLMADEGTVHKLLHMMETADDDDARRNAGRVLIRFAEHDENKTPHILITKTLAKDVKGSILDVLKKENSSYVVPELTVLIDAHFRPFFETQPYLESISKDPKFDAVARWRSINAIQQIMYAKQSLTENDVKFILDSLRSDDFWVRAEAAFITEILREDQVSPSQKHQLVAALDSAYDTEEKLIPKSFIAKALDRYNKINLYDTLKADFEKNHLANSISKNGITIKSSLPTSDLGEYLDLMKQQEQSFFEIMGPPFNTPVSGDPNDSLTLVLLGTPNEYSDYMNSFVGYGANAGGLYLENQGILYTFQRNANQSTYTVKDLIKHEFTHYLQGRYVYAGIWSDANYHQEPKGWADEGMAEFFSQSISTIPRTHIAEPSKKYLDEICKKDRSEYRDLISLLGQREGYDKSGQWDYVNSWAFAYYLMTEKKNMALNLYESFRDGSYNLDDFSTISGTSVDSLESDWHDTMTAWCKSR